MSETIQTKRCSHCKQIKPISEFHKNRSRKDEHRAYCKICDNNYVRQYAQTKKGKEKRKHYRQSEKGKAAHKRYEQSKKGKLARKRYDESKKGRAATKRYCQSEKGKTNFRKNIKKFRLLRPDQSKACHAVNQAIASGKLPRLDTLQCHYCSAQAEQYHHWKGYEPEYKLDVIPVCLRCHTKQHS